MNNFFVPGTCLLTNRSLRRTLVQHVFAGHKAMCFIKI